MPQTPIDHALQLAIQHHQAGRLDQAEAAYRQLLQRHPRQPDALHLLGLVLGQRGQLKESIDAISRAIAAKSDVAVFHTNLGESYRRLGDLDRAIAAFGMGLALNPNDAVAHSNLAAALCDNKALDESIAHCRKAIALSPKNLDAHVNLGNALRQQGKLDEAIEACRHAIAIDPNSAEAHNTLGGALLDQGKIEPAMESFRTAIRLKPALAAAHSNLGNVLRAQRKYDQALEEYAKAIAAKPNSGDAFYNLGITLRDMGRFPEAIAAYVKAIELRPDHAEAHNNLGNIVRFLGQLDRATDAFQAAIRINPDYAEAYNNLGGALTDQGRLDEALDLFRKAMALHPQAAHLHSNFVYTIHFHPDYDSATILEENRRWARQFEAPLREEIRPHDNDRTPDRRLKIGYVSPDFRTHAAACYLLPLLSHHNADNVEVYCYASVRRRDAMTARLRELPLLWRDSLGKSDAEMAQAVREDGIDILVDLTLHMADNRLLAFARKPAPLQVTWLGYPSTTGLSSIDYRLTDPYLDPPGIGDEFYSERSIRLPHTFWCYRPLAEQTPAVNPLPAEANGYVTFGCLNNFAKVTQPALDLWMRILQAVPRSRLLIQSHPGRHRRRVAQMFLDAGIAADRLEFVPKVPPAEYFAYYQRLDVCLDPLPYPGHTSSLDGLWMGVPSVTMAGRTGVGRGGVSIMTNVGLPQFIAATPEEYLEIAQQWAGNVSELATLRAGMRERLQSSPLMDAARFAADMEAAYRQMWRDYCAGKESGR